MIKKDFDVFANRYRLILEKGVKNYPEYYSKSTMLEYDRFIYESKKRLKKSNLLEGWRMPSISYIHPLQLVEKSLLSESHYIAINKLDEGIFGKVGGYIQRGMGRLFGAGSSDELKTQAGEADKLSEPPPGGTEGVQDQALGQLRIKHKSFRDQLGAVIALKNWSQKKNGTEPFWDESGKKKVVFDKELDAIEKEIREALPEITRVANLSEALSSRNRLARLSEVAITQGLFERTDFVDGAAAIAAKEGSVEVTRSAYDAVLAHLPRLKLSREHGGGLFVSNDEVLSIAKEQGIQPSIVRGILGTQQTTQGGGYHRIQTHGSEDGGYHIKEPNGAITAPPTPTPTPTPTPGPDHTPGRPEPEHPPAPPHTDPHTPPHAPPHAPDGGGHHSLWAGLAALVALGATYGGFAMRDRRKRLEALIAVKRYDEKTPAVELPAPDPVAEEDLPPLAVIQKAEKEEEAKVITPKTITGGVEPAVVAPVEAPKVGENGKPALPVIYVYKGNGGQGFQSRVAQKINKISGMNPKDVGRYQSISSKVMNALAKDLKNTGKFTVLESSKKAGSDNASLAATLEELNKVTQPQVREILRFEIYKLLQGAKLKVKSDILQIGSSPVVSLESEADATDTSSAEKGKEGTGTKTPAEKSPDENLKAKLTSMLISFPANQPKAFSKAEWNELFSANDKNFGGDGQEARLGRDVIRKYHEDPDFTTTIKFTPDQKNKNSDYQELVKLKNYGSVMESLRRKYRLGLITLREYSIRKQKIEMIVLKEQIKRQILSTRK